MARQRGHDQREEQRTQAVAPYRFVPLSKRVVFPAWSEAVSHDLPLSNGIRGHLEVEAEAETPILVGDDGKDGKRFVRYGSEAAIPGSSFRGMLRAVLEIVTFGKFGTYVDDRHLSIRDLRNAHVYRSQMTERDGNSYRAKSSGAWLEVDPQTGEWRLIPCKVARVRIRDLVDYGKQEGNDARVLEKLGKRQRGEEKYDKWKRAGLSLTLRFEPTGEKRQEDGLTYDLARKLGEGEEEGRLVFTGQPSDYDLRRGDLDRSNRGKKKKEFLFYAPEEGRPIPVPPTVRRAFVQAHSVNEQGSLPRPNKDWEFHKRALDRGERVPVFYLREGNALRAFGLASMFRLPYRLSTHQAIENTDDAHRDEERFDFAELLFGRVSKEGRSLRGRVSCEPLWAQGEARSFERVETLLGTPKPSFYPYYVDQTPRLASRTAATVNREEAPGDRKKSPRYQTLMDEDAELSGWKRYPVRPPGEVRPWPQNRDSPKVNVSLHPLPPGTRFRGRIHVHNLRPEELGALMWALTWGGDEDLRHSLGMGKPFGYGRLKVRVEAAELEDAQGNRVDWQEARKAFEDFMEAGAGLEAWRNSEQLAALRCFANPAASEGRSDLLRHPSLQAKEFSRIKKNGLALSPLCDFQGTPDRKLYPRERRTDRERRKREAEAQERKRAEEERKRAEEARLKAMGPAERFRTQFATASDFSQAWAGLMKLADDCSSPEEKQALREAAEEHASLQPKIAEWRKLVKRYPSGGAEYGKLKKRKRKQVDKAIENLEFLDRLG